jgi:hypothetical protein
LISEGTKGYVRLGGASQCREIPDEVARKRREVLVELQAG